MFRFKIWNQGNDGNTMGIRVADVSELDRMRVACTEPSLGGRWSNLDQYLQHAASATTQPDPSYSRIVNVVWLRALGYPSPITFNGRTFVVTYTGNARVSGGFASQGYCITDPHGYPLLAAHHQTDLIVQYIPGSFGDTIVVMP